MPEKIRKCSPETLAAQALGWVDEETRAVVPPLHLSTTFERAPDNSFVRNRSYARADSPAFNQAEALLAALEGGAEAMVFASGMAAATCVFLSLAPGDHVIAPRVMYWALRDWLARSSRLEVTFVDSDTEAFRDALIPGRTRLVWMETPANPLWHVSDIEAVSGLAHRAGARVAVDSTVA